MFHVDYVTITSMCTVWWLEKEISKCVIFLMDVGEGHYRDLQQGELVYSQLVYCSRPSIQSQVPLGSVPSTLSPQESHCTYKAALS